MDEDRVRKAEKLEARTTKKLERDGHPDENSDSSLGFSSSLELPDNANRPDAPSEEDSSTISEHLNSFRSDGIENDRSLSEIDFDLRISQEKGPTSLNSSLKSETNEAANDVQEILDDILNDRLFFSKTEKSDSSSTRDVSLNIFEGVSLDDSSINNYVSKLKETENDKELSRKNSDLDELKSGSSVTTSVTEYKGCQNDSSYYRTVEFQNALAHRDALIKELTDLLHQSTLNNEALERHSENFTKQIALLQKQLSERSKVIKQHKCFESEQWSPIRKKFAESKESPSSSSIDITDFAQDKTKMGIDVDFSKLEEVLSPNQLLVLNELKGNLHLYVQQKIVEIRDVYEQELKVLKDKLEEEKTSSVKLKDLEGKHAEEMEELRTYFEKKCADLEKNYSEEIFSQQSRKMSGSSTGSEQELVHDLQCPGPGGDANPCSQNTTPKRSLTNLTKDDVLKIKAEVTNFCRQLEKYDQEGVSEDILKRFKEDFSSSNLSTFAKFKFWDLQNEIQNKYNAELEILREDYENKIDERDFEHKSGLEKLKETHQDELVALRHEVEQALQAAQVNAAVQEVGSSGDFDITVQSYEQRLQEQVAFAKLDIFNNLEHQIRMLAENSDDRHWPPDLLQIKRCFCEKYEAQIEELERKHEDEVRQLKDKHFKVLSGALERARKRSLKENEGFTEDEMQILRDRDTLKKSNTTLRNLIAELLKYFTRCEDELNKTLIDEILRQEIERDLDPEISSSFNESFSKRVHFTPNLNLTAIDSPMDSNVSTEFRNELGSCLERLKSDANAILTLTVNMKNGPKRINPKILDGNLENQLEEAKEYARNLESERVSLENQVEGLVAKQKILEKDLAASNRKIAELIECGHKEVVSEGYGQSDSLGGRIANLAELQEKARNLMAEWKNGDPLIIQLVDELCREGERITDEAKRDREDLRQQIEAADKKLRANCQFLEEQAMEREQERDDAQKEIENLREQLREKEKERQTRELVAKEDDGFLELNECCLKALTSINSTVEHLESQMREMTKLIELGEVRQQEVETERKEAIDKIYFLRDIIRDLEAQVEKKKISEKQLQEFVSKLEPVVKQQSETIQELSEQLEVYKSGPDVNELKERIVYLEKEAQKLRINNELAGNEGAIKEIQIRLHEFEGSIDKKTRDLEGLHSALSTTECSTPSEEMSYRDNVRPSTPSGLLDECDVPLQQLARLKEKLIKHSRAEDAAVKRIRDLEMQLTSNKQELEDTQNEKEILQNQVTEQIVLLSSLQLRLDEQRLKAEQNQKQANTSLELKIYDLENEVQSLKDTMHAKDKGLKQLNKIVEETKKQLENREKELNSRDNDEIVLSLEKEIARLKEENYCLKVKIESDAQNAQILPGLVDNIIADKNSDIEKLRSKLDDTQKQLESFLSLNLDSDQLRLIGQMKSSERGFSDFLNLTEVGGPMRHAAENSIESSLNFPPRQKVLNDTVDITKIDSKLVQNSTQIPKKVHFEDIEIEKLKDEIAIKDETLKEYSENFERERDNFKEIEKDLRIELAEKKMKLSEAEKELESSLEDHNRKDKMYMNLAKEKREIEMKSKDFDEVISRKDEEISNLEDQLSKFIANCVAFEEIETKLKDKDKSLEELKEKFEILQRNFEEKSKKLDMLQEEFDNKSDENQKLSKEINNQTRQIENLTRQLRNVENEVVTRNNEIQKLKDLVADKNCEIKILNEDIQRHQNESKNIDHQKEISEKNIEIIKLKSIQEELNKEIVHLQDYLQEKDNVIEQMQDDTKSLHVNLETIQSKIQETGNIVDLRKRLQEEKHLNAVLKEEIRLLKNGELKEKCSSLEDIRGEVQKQLDYSARLDSNIMQALSSGDEEKETKEIFERSQLKLELQQLEMKLQKEKENVDKLTSLLDKERHICNSLQIEDSNLIEQLRIQLEASLDARGEMENLLENEKKLRFDLENEIKRLKSDLSSSSKTEVTEYKRLPSAESQELYKLREEVTLLTDSNEKLKSEIKSLRKSKNEQMTDLKYTKDMLSLKVKELERFETKFEDFRRCEMELKEKLITYQNELDNREREVENSRILMAELEQERLDLKKEHIILNDRLRELQEEKQIAEVLLQEKESSLNSTVPEKLVNKMRELTVEIKKQMEENKILTNNLTKMAVERSKFLDKIRKLERSGNEPGSRSNHLFGKYLRSESYRKALIWQKEYLIKLLLSYQEIEPNVRSLFEPKYPRRRLQNPKQKFKACVTLIIAISRMKYMVQRWHSGVRNAAHNIPKPPRRREESDVETRFEVGQPVSSQNFYPSVHSTDLRYVRTPTVVEGELTTSWSGTSPPQKDRIVNPSKNFAPLQTPLLLSEYVQRFDEMQQRLGLAFEKMNS